MKKAEKILLFVLLALLICRMAGVPGASGLFALGCFTLALAYLVWGYRLLRVSPNVPAWLAVTAGIALATSLATLPFATYARKEAAFLLPPLINGAFLVFLLVRSGISRIRRSGSAEGPRALLVRSSIAFTALAFLSYMPPNAAYRSVIMALNRGDDGLIANMRMVEESQAFEEAYERGDCERALRHAERSNEQGRIWLFGVAQAQARISLSDGYQLELDSINGYQFDLDSIIRGIQEQQQRSQLWKISRTYDNLYKAHRCLAGQAESALQAGIAFHHYRMADSLLNVIQDRTGDWGEECAWSLGNVARTAARIGEHDLSDSLFNVALKRYKDAKGGLDADGSVILADWASSLSRRQEWPYANYLLRVAIDLGGPDGTGNADEPRWVRHHLQLVRNLIATDSLGLAGNVLRPCMGIAHKHGALHCEALLVKGALQYRQNIFRAADTTFQEAVSCLSSLGGNDQALAFAHLAWGHVKTALADYASARGLVVKGQEMIASEGTRSPVHGSLLQLSASIHHLQGEYMAARREYERSMHALAGEGAGAMAGLADVLIDLAEPRAGKALADSALAMVADSLSLIRPGQTSILNTAAYADYHLGDHAMAQQRYAIALDVCRRYAATGTTTYAQALNGQGLVAMALSRTAMADSLLAQAHALCLDIHGREHPFTARVMINQAMLRMRQDRHAEAWELLMSAMPITERFLGKDHDQLGDIHRALGDIERRRGRRSEADARYREAHRIYKVCFPAEHPDVLALERIIG